MKRFLFFLVLSVCAGRALFAQTLMDPVVAEVRLSAANPRLIPITQKQLKAEMENTARMAMMQRGQNPAASQLTEIVQKSTLAERKEILDQMIAERLILQAAARDGIRVEDNEFNQILLQQKTVTAQQEGVQLSQFSENDFARVVKRQLGLEMAAYHERLRQQIVFDRYMQQKNEAIVRTIKAPTEAEIVTYYNQNKAMASRPDYVNYSFIQVLPGADEAATTRARALAERLSTTIGSDPTKFTAESLKGRTPNAEFRAGDGGYTPLVQQVQAIMGKAFYAALLTMSDGDISKVIETPRGFYIIRVTGTYPAKQICELDEVFRFDASSPTTPATIPVTVREAIVRDLREMQRARATEQLLTELRNGTVTITDANLNW